MICSLTTTARNESRAEVILAENDVDIAQNLATTFGPHKLERTLQFVAMESSSREQKDRDDVKNAFAQLESAAEHMVAHEESGPATKKQPESSAKVEPAYSTRGRPQDEPSSLEAAGDLLSIAKELGVSDPSTRIRESFLSDSLTEKEIRTRTRVLPNLDGMNSLRKGEIKSDLAIARGDKQSLAPINKKRKVRGDTNSDDAATQDDDTAMDTADDVDPSVFRTVQAGKLTFGIPSQSFAPPATPTVGKRPSPRQVDSIVAFNPPRPPESIGAKKEHRLRNWERRPETIENDLRRNRTTIDKIRYDDDCLEKKILNFLFTATSCAPLKLNSKLSQRSTTCCAVILSTTSIISTKKSQPFKRK